MAAEILCKWNRPRATFGPRSFWPFWKKTFRRMEKSQLTLRNPFCLSEASFTDFSKVTFFQVFWKTRPSIFGTFVAMTKVRSRVFQDLLSLLEGIGKLKKGRDDLKGVRQQFFLMYLLKQIDGGHRHRLCSDQDSLLCVV